MSEWWPQIVYFALSLFGLGVTLAKHGEQQPRYNFLTTLATSLFVYWLLYMGGFFTKNGGLG